MKHEIKLDVSGEVPQAQSSPEATLAVHDQQQLASPLPPPALLPTHVDDPVSQFRPNSEFQNSKKSVKAPSKKRADLMVVHD